MSGDGRMGMEEGMEMGLRSQGCLWSGRRWLKVLP